MRRLGVDPGSVRTGLAVAEDDVPVATPLATVTHRSFAEAIDKVASIVASEQIDEIVVGLPLSLDGRAGEAARRAQRFADALAERTKLPLVMWDERLSSASAERALRTMGRRRSEQRAMVDQAAATLLLQSYLDGKRNEPWDDESATENAPPRDTRGRRARREP